MPSYVITSPEGKKYKVSGEGTADEALAHFQSTYTPEPQQEAPLPQQKQPEQSISRTALDQGLQGATFGFGDEITDRIGAGIASLATGEKYGDLLKEARTMSKDRMSQQMEQNPATSIAANIGGALLTGGAGVSTKAGASAANMLRSGGTAARIGKGALVGGASGGLYGAGIGEEGDRLESARQGAISGAAFGGAIPAAGATLSGIKKAASPVAEEGLREVGKLAQKYNIPLSLDQITGSAALKNVQKISQEIPLSGQQGFREKQMKAFNKALFKTVGVDADRFTPENMSLAFSKVGGEFDDLTKGQSFNIGGTFIDDLASTADDVASTYGKEASEIFQREASKVIGDFTKGDTISGELISRQRARINAMARKASDPNIKGALLDLENNIVDGITSKDAGLQKALSSAKQRYKNLIVLEPIANKAKGGMISPSLLNNRVSQVYKRSHTTGNSGDIGNLARVGHELLPQLGGSDTTQKMAYIGAMTAGATNPATVPTIGAAVGANRAFQSGINRNQSLVAGALKRAAPKSNNGIAPVLSAPAGIAGAIESKPLPNVTVTPQGGLPEVQLPVVSPRSEAPNDLMSRIAQVESGGNPNAKNPNSSASGLFQFTNDTWNSSVQRWGKELGITNKDKANPQAQLAMAQKLAESNANYIEKNLGIKPDDGQIYLAHFMGAPAAVKLMKNYGRGISAAQIFPKAAKSNQSIFFDTLGKARTIEQVYDIITKKVEQV
jgi:hypothetical protein